MTTLTSEPTQYDHPGLERISSGNPKIVLGLTGVHQERAYLESYKETGLYPHITLDFDTGTVHEHVPLDRACPMFGIGAIRAPHRHTTSVWVFINRNAGEVLSDEETYTLRSLVQTLVADLGAAKEVLDFPGSARVALNSELPFDVWESFSGVVPISVVPNGTWQNAFPWNPSDLFGGEEAVGVLFGRVEDVNPEESPVIDLGEFKGRSIALGSTGKKVAALREAFDMGPGDFDIELEMRVQAVQDAHGLEGNGVVEAWTWAALQENFDQ